jgi:Holliday junction resolvase RusA-like endonuclease
MIAFTVFGVAQPAGSKRAFYNKKAARVIVTDDNKRSRPWKAEVASAAQTAMLAQSVTPGGTLVDGPLELSLTFVVPRPKGHFGAKGSVRPSAPSHPIVRPDVLKLARGVEDACTGIVWRDDSQIVVEMLRKEYGEPARCEIFVARVSEPSENGSPLTEGATEGGEITAAT